MSTLYKLFAENLDVKAVIKWFMNQGIALVFCVCVFIYAQVQNYDLNKSNEDLVEKINMIHLTYINELKHCYTRNEEILIEDKKELLEYITLQRKVMNAKKRDSVSIAIKKQEDTVKKGLTYSLK